MAINQTLHLERQVTKLKRELAASRRQERATVAASRKVIERADKDTQLANRLNAFASELQREIDSLKHDNERLQQHLVDALNVWARLGLKLRSWITYPYWATIRESFLNYVAVRRLSGGRWAAMVQGGYTSDLQTMRQLARHYWEYDRGQRPPPRQENWIHRLTEWAAKHT